MASMSLLRDRVDQRDNRYNRQQPRDLSGIILPDYSAPDSKFAQHFKKRCNKDTSQRIELMREWQVARAMVLSKQWLDLNMRDGRRSSQATRFTEPNPKLKFPRPVNNEIYPIFDNEVSKLARRKSSAYVRPVAVQEGSGGPTGATKATDIMDWHLETISWSRKRRNSIIKDVLYGTVGYWSHLDQSYMHTVPVGVTEARRCVNCDYTLATTQLPDEDAMAAMGHHSFVDPDLASRTTQFDPATASPVHTYTAKACLACGSPLAEYSPTADSEEELSGLVDVYNRPLATDVPYNQPDVEIVPPWELFFENDGIGFDEPRQINEVYRVTPRRIDTYAAEHYPELVDQIKPDSPEKIADFFPFIGDYAYGNDGHLSANDRNIWQNHYLEYTAVIKPKKVKGYDNGRYCIYGGGIRLRDEELQRPSTRRKGVMVPLVKVAFARFFVKDSEVHGQGITVPLVSPQNRINMMAAQITDVRQRNSVNAIVAPFDMQFTSGWIDGHNGRYLRYRPSVMMPNAEPRFVETRTIDQGVYQEYDRTTDRMQQYAGAQDVDLGKAPRNVSAATAIQMLIGQTEGRRFAREEELIDSFREVYSHQLLLLAEFAREPRQYRAKNSAGKWEYRTFQGMDLEGHTDVIVEEQAGYDAKAYQREAVLQAVQLQLLVANTPYARREILKALDIPTRAVDEDNVQISDADAKWYAFRDFQQVPEPDDDIDDHVIMFQTYGRYLKAPEGVDIAKKSNWTAVLSLIAGWQEDLKSAMLQDTMIKSLMGQAQMPPQPVPQIVLPGQPPPAPDPGEIARMTLQHLMMIGQDPRSMILPPTMKDKIMTIWQRRGVSPELLMNPHTQMRAVLSAHMVLGEQQKTAASMGPKFAAPGGSTTPFGTVPTAGNIPQAEPAGGSGVDNSGNPPQLTAGAQG